MAGKNKQGFAELTITNMNPEIKKQLKTIAKNKGVTVSCMLRPVFREFIDKNPDQRKEFRD